MWNSWGWSSWWACDAYYYGCDAGAAYASWYPDDGATRYFYESFPEVTTPMAGIMNERFFVWMRAAVIKVMEGSKSQSTYPFRQVERV